MRTLRKKDERISASFNEIIRIFPESVDRKGSLRSASHNVDRIISCINAQTHYEFLISAQKLGKFVDSEVHQLNN